MKRSKTNAILIDALQKGLPVTYSTDRTVVKYYHITQKDKLQCSIETAQASSFTHNQFGLLKDDQAGDPDYPDASAYVVVNCHHDFMENYYPHFVKDEDADIPFTDFITKYPLQAVVFFNPNTQNGLAIDYIMPIYLEGYDKSSYDAEDYQVFKTHTDALDMVEITCKQMKAIIDAVPKNKMPYLKYPYKLYHTKNLDWHFDDNTEFNTKDYYIFKADTNNEPIDNWRAFNSAINHWFIQHITTRVNPNDNIELEFVIKGAKNPFYKEFAQKLSNGLRPDTYAYSGSNTLDSYLACSIPYLQWDANETTYLADYIGDYDDSTTEAAKKLDDFIKKNAAKSKFGVVDDNDDYYSYYGRRQSCLPRDSYIVCYQAEFTFDLKKDIKPHIDALLLPENKNCAFDVVDPQEKHSLSAIFEDIEYLGKHEKVYAADKKLTVLLGDDTIKRIVSKDL